MPILSDSARKIFYGPQATLRVNEKHLKLVRQPTTIIPDAEVIATCGALGDVTQIQARALLYKASNYHAL